jgi:hypothetical protein
MDDVPAAAPPTGNLPAASTSVAPVPEPFVPAPASSTH